MGRQREREREQTLPLTAGGDAIARIQSPARDGAPRACSSRAPKGDTGHRLSRTRQIQADLLQPPAPRYSRYRGLTEGPQRARHLPSSLHCRLLALHFSSHAGESYLASCSPSPPWSRCVLVRLSSAL
eukprot:scaffold252255_cov32-Tisochrysis_lutea.AAC.1